MFMSFITIHFGFIFHETLGFWSFEFLTIIYVNPNNDTKILVWR